MQYVDFEVIGTVNTSTAVGLRHVSNTTVHALIASATRRWLSISTASSSIVSLVISAPKEDSFIVSLVISAAKEDSSLR